MILEGRDRRAEHRGLIPVRRLLRRDQHQGDELVIVQPESLYQDGPLILAVIHEHAKRHEAVGPRVPEHDLDELDQRVAVGDQFLRLVGRRM